MNEEEIQLYSTRLLTEHFGFQPITVIDDIINVINEIMYRCTEQLEQILINQKIRIDEATNEKLRKQRSDDVIVDMHNSSQNDESKKYTIEDIQIGTATLESYLEHSINRNFDKFEVYALRNVFNLPEELVSGGYIRLKHHEGLQVYDKISQTDRQITEVMLETVKEIQYQIALNKALCESLPKLQKLSQLSKMIKMRLQPFLITDHSNAEDKKVLAQLTPLNDTIIFLVTQLRSTCDKVNSMKDLINDDNLAKKFLKGSKEEEQLNERINVIIERVTKTKEQGLVESSTLSNTTIREDQAELSKIDSSSGQNIIDFFLGDKNIVS